MGRARLSKAAKNEGLREICQSLIRICTQSGKTESLLYSSDNPRGHKL